ncbi:glycoside hydrolase [Frankia sp. CgMI4]|uniref:C40 family peptidase n=1 Tax=Frankia sp. CgMI4 TaxID=1742262 RepID=UPI000871FF04|nr:C40 family peptidase [Frankia sp. CgIM4]OFB41449.1 glycoside hydrolase [Frankia sp. CgIM4]
MSSVPTEGWHSAGEPRPGPRRPRDVPPSGFGRRTSKHVARQTPAAGPTDDPQPTGNDPTGWRPKAGAPIVLGLVGILVAGPPVVWGFAGSAWAAPTTPASGSAPESPESPESPQSLQSLQSLQAEINGTRVRLDESTRQTAIATEVFNAERIRLVEAERAAAAAAGRVDRADDAVRQASDKHRGLAVSANRAGGFGQLSLLLTGDPRQVLDRAGAVDALARRQRVADTGLRLARRDLTEARRSADVALAGKRKIVMRLAARKRSIEASAAEQRSLLQRLESRYASLERRARERQAAAARARRAAAAAAAASAARKAAAERVRYRKESAAVAAAGRAFAAAPTTPAPIPPTGGGGASRAVQEAYAQLGKPYVWAAAGPKSFDCSGLTQWVWGKAGVSLSHYTGSQWNEGRRVNRAGLIPGDLVFFHADLDHVGIYIGGGKMIHAPRTGEVVKVEKIWWSSFRGGVRPGA